MLDLDILHYPTLQALINSKEDSDNIFKLHATQENDDKNEFYVNFPVKHISSRQF